MSTASSNSVVHPPSGSGGGGDVAAENSNSNKRKYEHEHEHELSPAAAPTSKTTVLVPTATATATASATATATANNNNTDDDDDATRQVTPTFAGASSTSNKTKKTKKTSCPYRVREALLADYMHSANGGTAHDGENPDEFIQMIAIDHILKRVPGLQLHDEEDEDKEHLDDMTQEQLAHLCDGLSLEQVEKYHHIMIVRRGLMNKIRTVERKLYQADTRSGFGGDDDDDDSLGGGGGGGFVMLNTHSTWCMYPVIAKELTAAQKLINQATKAVSTIVSNDTNNSNSSSSTNNLARNAFEVTLAVVLGIDNVDHWRHDTEDPNESNKIFKKVAKLLKEVLWFTDAELGLVDPFTRAAVLAQLQHISHEWKESEVWAEEFPHVRVTFETAKNGKGKGRSNATTTTKKTATKQPYQSASASAAAAVGTGTGHEQQQRGVASFFAPAASSTTKEKGSTANNGDRTATTTNPGPAVEFLGAVGDCKLSLRAKTHMQLRITEKDNDDDEEHHDPHKKKKKTKKTTAGSCNVIISGATDMKKFGQLLAYLTGYSHDYQYHSQKGKAYTSGNFTMEITTPTTTIGDIDDTSSQQSKSKSSTITIADKKFAKLTTSHVVTDKAIKITQLFQGLTISSTSGVMYDSEQAASLQLTWSNMAQTQIGAAVARKEYAIVCTGILPIKSICAKASPLPRVVNAVMEDNANSKMTLQKGSGEKLFKINEYLRGDRSGPKLWFLRGPPSKAALKKLHNGMSTEPICNAEGGSTIKHRSSHDGDDDDDSRYQIPLFRFDTPSLESGGLPTNGGYRITVPTKP